MRSTIRLESKFLDQIHFPLEDKHIVICRKKRVDEMPCYKQPLLNHLECEWIHPSNPPLIKGTKGESQRSIEPDARHCDYCGKPWHLKDTCWKLHGWPNVSPNLSLMSTQTETGLPREDQSSGGLCNIELQALRSLLTKLETSTSNAASTPCSHIAHSSIPYYALQISKIVPNNHNIIDNSWTIFWSLGSHDQ